MSVPLQASESNVFTRPDHGALEFAIAGLPALRRIEARRRS